LEAHISKEHLRHVYFGELYWADNFYEYETETVSIPTGEIVKQARKITSRDIMFGDKYRLDDEGKEVEETYYKKLEFQSERTLVEYLWETDSEVLKGFMEFFPSIRMGKQLELKIEPSLGKILDSNLRECYKCIQYKDENNFSNDFNYMRSDLLRRYMFENNLVLVYQVKQHSYDENREHTRQLNFYFLE
jgi:hypothetical protein